MIDVVQMEFDPIRIAAVGEESTWVLEQLMQVMMANPEMKMDKCLFTMRLGTVDKDMRAFFESRLHDGVATVMSNKYKKLWTDLNEVLGRTCLEIRAKSDLVATVKHYEVGEEIRDWAATFFTNFDGLFRSADRQFKFDKDASSFVKITTLYNKLDAFEEYVGEMIDRLMVNEDWEDRIIGLYKWVTSTKLHRSNKPNAKDWKSGRYDRIIFQTSSRGSLSDYLGMALKQKGVIR